MGADWSEHTNQNPMKAGPIQMLLDPTIDATGRPSEPGKLVSGTELLL